MSMYKCYLVAFLFLLSCKCPQYTAETFPDKQLIVGKSGGFAGKETSYVVLNSGQVFEKTFPDEKTTEMKGLKASSVRKLFKTAWKKGWKDYKYNKPGNLTHFVIFKDKSFENKVSWSVSDTLVSKDIRKLHSDLYHIVNPKSSVK